jgi:two-component system, NarL family, sensor kinase
VTSRGGAAALLRVALLPVAYLGHAAAEADAGAGFTPWLVVATVYSLGTLALAASGRSMPWPALAAVDLVLLAGLAYHSGGAESHLRHAFLALPLSAAFFMRPEVTGAWAAAAVGAYATVATVHPVTPDVQVLVAHVATTAWLGGASVVFSAVLARRSSDIGQLAASRGELLSELLGAEQRERRDLADALHDGPVQALALARIRLATARAAGTPGLDSACDAIAEASGQLRATISDLHPYVLDAAGLAIALEAVADRVASDDGPLPTVTVEDAAEGYRDGLVFSVARELLANVAKHAQANRVDVEVVRTADGIRLTVADDGRGLDPAARRAAVRGGHIGLASCEKRLQAVGGTLKVSSVEDVGTWVEATIPLRRQAQDADEASPPPERWIDRRRRLRGFERRRPASSDSLSEQA